MSWYTSLEEKMLETKTMVMLNMEMGGVGGVSSDGVGDGPLHHWKILLSLSKQLL